MARLSYTIYHFWGISPPIRYQGEKFRILAIFLSIPS
jgi:hypothetical protein